MDDEQRRRIAAGQEPAGRFDGPVTRIYEAQRLAKNPPITNPAPFTAEQMAKLSDLDKIQISHWQKNNPGMRERRSPPT